MDWNQKQRDFIEALSSLVGTFDKILGTGDSPNIIDNANRNKLSVLKKRSEEILRKLESKEFTVALVGLENSGKSSLGNALIGISNLLPTDELRCTYTITKAIAGQVNRGEVTLYTLEEFKEKFSEMVKAVSAFHGIADFENITWKQISDKDPVTNKEKDIKAMIDNRDSILGLLAGDNVLGFNGEELTTPEFKQYITGKGANNLFNGYPYAVKEITIRSKNFQNMEDIVLYDVPGFDSTTELHKEQTDVMINEADAVILIVNLYDGAEIKSTQTAIFKTGRDKYGTPYKNKVFVFGNKADLIFTSGNITNPKETARKNRNALIASAQMENISDEKYINCGSVQSYNAGTEQTLLDIELGLKEEIINGTCGVELLRKKLEEYYRTVRYAVLTQRVGDILKEARTILEDINIECEDAETDDGGEFYYEAAENLDNFMRAAYDLIQNKIHEIRKARPFSNSLEEKNLTKLLPFQSVDSAILREIEQSQPLNAYEIFHAENIEPEFRARVFQIFLNNIVDATGTSMKDTEQEIYKELKDCFLKNMGMSEDTGFEERADLEKSVEELFGKLRGDTGANERRSSESRANIKLLLEVLIKCRLNSRVTTISDNDNWTRLRSIANYYAANLKSDDKKQGVAEFFMKILMKQTPPRTRTTPRNVETFANTKNALQSFFDRKAQEKFLSGLTVEQLPLDEWASELLRVGETFNANDELGENFTDLMTDNWSYKRGSDKIALLNKTFADYIAEFKEVTPPAAPVRKDSSLPEAITPAWIREIATAAEQHISSKEEMIKILNNDISNLHNLTLNALISVLNMEGEFISGLIKDVDGIRYWKNSSRGKKAVKNWVKKNTRKIRAKDFIRINEEKSKNEKRKADAESIETALNELAKRM